MDFYLLWAESWLFSFLTLVSQLWLFFYTTVLHLFGEERMK